MNLEHEERLWVSVPEGGEIFGLGRSASYAAAARGELPVLKIGGRLLVVVAGLREMLGIAEERDDGTTP